jgi:hypothetical protein
MLGREIIMEMDEEGPTCGHQLGSIKVIVLALAPLARREGDLEEKGRPPGGGGEGGC